MYIDPYRACAYTWYANLHYLQAQEYIGRCTVLLTKYFLSRIVVTETLQSCFILSQTCLSFRHAEIPSEVVENDMASTGEMQLVLSWQNGIDAVCQKYFVAQLQDKTT